MPDRVKKKPTERQQAHREMFAAAIKHAKAIRRAYLQEHGVPGMAESYQIYLAAIKDFIAGAREAGGLKEFLRKDEAKKPEQEKVIEKIKEKGVGKTKSGKGAK